MTVQDLFNELQSKTNKPLNLITIRRRINEAIDFFSAQYSRIFFKEETIVNCTDIDTHYDLPDNCIGISKVLDSKNFKYLCFKVFNNTIKFGKIDTYTVIYTVKANLLNTKDSKLLKNEEINVNPLFLRAITTYIQYLIESDPTKAANYMSTANSLAQEANFMAGKMDSGRPKKIAANTSRWW